MGLTLDGICKLYDTIILKVTGKTHREDQGGQGPLPGTPGDK